MDLHTTVVTLTDYGFTQPKTEKEVLPSFLLCVCVCLSLSLSLSLTVSRSFSRFVFHDVILSPASSLTVSELARDVTKWVEKRINCG